MRLFGSPSKDVKRTTLHARTYGPWSPQGDTGNVDVDTLACMKIRFAKFGAAAACAFVFLRFWGVAGRPQPPDMRMHICGEGRGVCARRVGELVGFTIGGTPSCLAQALASNDPNPCAGWLIPGVCVVFGRRALSQEVGKLCALGPSPSLRTI